MRVKCVVCVDARDVKINRFSSCVGKSDAAILRHRDATDARPTKKKIGVRKEEKRPGKAFCDIKKNRRQQTNNKDGDS